MTAANRARLGLARCARKAAAAQARADAAATPQGRREWSELAADYQRSADEWAKLLDDLDETAELGCTDCGAADGETCDDDCDCNTCENERALADDHA